MTTAVPRRVEKRQSSAAGVRRIEMHTYLYTFSYVHFHHDHGIHPCTGKRCRLWNGTRQDETGKLVGLIQSRKVWHF